MTKMSYLRKRFKSESNLTHKTANFPNFASQERPAVKQKEDTSMRRCGREIVRGEDEFLPKTDKNMHLGISLMALLLTRGGTKAHEQGKP